MEDLLYNSPSWELLIDCNCTLMENVSAWFDPHRKRKPFPKIDETMETLWQSKVKENNRLFNQSKFRFESASNTDSKINLILGVTDYKETFCTNHLPSSDHIRQYGADNYNDKHACFGDALGVGGVVVTSDGFLVLQKRSDWVAESKGCYDTPGGHAEPEELLKKFNANSDPYRSDPKLFGDEVVYEIFHSIVREVRDEVNIPESSLSWPVLLGINRNKTYGYKPGMIFYLTCSLCKAEVERLYLQGGLETDESTEIKFIPSNQLVMASQEDFLLLTSNMAPLGQLALALYVHHHKLLRLSI